MLWGRTNILGPQEVILQTNILNYVGILFRLLYPRVLYCIVSPGFTLRCSTPAGYKNIVDVANYSIQRAMLKPAKH